MADPNASRRTALKNMATLALAPVSTLPSWAETQAWKGKIHHSVCRWCFGELPLEALCKALAAMGVKALDLVGENDWAILQKYGITCSMVNGAELNLVDGFNAPKFHDDLVSRYEALIPKAAAAGYKNIICFSGNRRGMSDGEGLANCATGIKRLLPSLEKHNMVLHMELLNSRVDHKDYQCDHTEWGVALCKEIGSERFKLLYDIYHMQIMEGDLIRTIRKHHAYLGHYHTAGNPGRNELDENQEIYYPAIMREIAKTGFKGYVAQEFIPKSKKPLESLKKAFVLCDI